MVAFRFSSCRQKRLQIHSKAVSDGETKAKQGTVYFTMCVCLRKCLYTKTKYFKNNKVFKERIMKIISHIGMEIT